MKKITKKALSLLLALTMALGLAACGEKKDDTTKPDSGAQGGDTTQTETVKNYKKEIIIGQQQDITDFTIYTNKVAINVVVSNFFKFVSYNVVG